MVRFRELYKGEKEPVLLSGRISTGRSGDQYYFIYVTSTGPFAEQYWSQSPLNTITYYPQREVTLQSYVDSRFTGRESKVFREER